MDLGFDVSAITREYGILFLGILFFIFRNLGWRAWGSEFKFGGLEFDVGEMTSESRAQVSVFRVQVYGLRSEEGARHTKVGRG